LASPVFEWVASIKQGLREKGVQEFPSASFSVAFRNLCGLSLQFKLNLGLQQNQSETEKVKMGMNNLSAINKELIP